MRSEDGSVGADRARDLAEPGDGHASSGDAFMRVSRPRAPEEAMAMGRDWFAIDTSTMHDDTIPLPWRPPGPTLAYLARVPVPKRRREEALSRTLRDLQGRSLGRKRSAALVLGSWPPSTEIDQELLRALVCADDSLTAALAACSLAAHGYPDASPFLALHETANERQWPEEATMLIMVALAAVASQDGVDMAIRGRVRSILSEESESQVVAACQRELLSRIPK